MVKKGGVSTRKGARKRPKVPKKFSSTAEIEVPENILDQVIGQEEAVDVMKKAGQRRRHVLLIGEPGTGKSMLGLALAEMLPKEKLVDVLSFPNQNDENQPLIRTVQAGEGRKIVMSAKMSGENVFRNQGLIMLVLAILAMIVPWWVFNSYTRDYNPTVGAVMFLAFFIGGMIFLVMAILFMNLGKRMNQGKVAVPKIIVDNYKREEAPFHDATGAHAGALLGDVLHDPFQCFFPLLKINIAGKGDMELAAALDTYWENPHIHREASSEKKNYEAVFLPKNELRVAGVKGEETVVVDVLSANRHDYEGEMIRICTAEGKELLVTPEHKIAVSRRGQTMFAAAEEIVPGDDVVAQSADVILSEWDIIHTFDESQREQCRLYYQYLALKEQEPTWGYKRIAKALDQPYAKTRWWHTGKHVPAPIQTINWLNERDLLPLKKDHPHLPVIARILGTTFGDGGIFENLNGLFLSSSEREAVDEFARDLEGLFWLREGENSRVIEGGEYGHSWCYQHTNRNVIRFFLALGAPRGNKTNVWLKIPSWLCGNAEDEFYASFFGNEMGIPSVHKSRKRLTGLEVGITGTARLHKNRLEFLGTVRGYLQRKGIRCNSIYEKELENGNMLYRLLLSTRFENVFLFFLRINLNYAPRKAEKLGETIGEWALEKQNRYQRLLCKGYGAERAMRTLKLTPEALYLLLNEFGAAKVSV